MSEEITSEMSEHRAMEELRQIILEKDKIIEFQSDKIKRIEEELIRVRNEKNNLMRNVAELNLIDIKGKDNPSLLNEDSVTSAKFGEEIRSRKSQSVGNSPHESPRTSKLVSQGSISCSRLQRQRSLKNASDDVIKKYRTSSVSYELSQDLHDKQVEMLERKYGGSFRSRRAAKTIQRAFRQYCMTKNFQKLRHSVGERRYSKRLSEIGRSNTIWTDRVIYNDKFNGIGGESCENENGDESETFGSDVRKMVAEFESNRHNDQRVHIPHQMSVDQGLKMNDNRRGLLKRDKKNIDFTDIPECEKDKKITSAVIDETNNNRNSYPEMNESAKNSEGVENSVDPHSLDFETLLENKEDILTDSFHSDSVYSDGGHDVSLTKRPSASSLNSESSYNTTVDSARGNSILYDSLRTESHDPTSPSDVQIKVDLASPEDTRMFDQKQLKDQSVKYYMNTKVKLRSRKSEEDLKPIPPKRTPETSPIWKRKGNAPIIPVINGNVNVNALAEPKRMSNISEISEPDSYDGQCSSSSPSSENISQENISISSENSVSYQPRLRLSVTPDHQTLPRTNDKQRKRLYRIGLNLFNKKPDKGLNFLIDHGFLDGSPKNIARFFITRKGVSKQMIGEFLGNLQNQFNMEVLHYFTEVIDLSGLQVDMALRKFVGYFRMPGEAQKIERLMEAFASRYCTCNPDQAKYFKSADTIFLLAFAIIMLNTDLHNSNVKPERKMKQEDFIKNLRGIDSSDDIDRDLLLGIYERVKSQEFKAGVDQVTQVLKVEQSIVGKKPEEIEEAIWCLQALVCHVFASSDIDKPSPDTIHPLFARQLNIVNQQLALSHRRLVCYCRLYEVHDPCKKEKIGLHQREVFLFNDQLLVTKIFSKKKSVITYNYRMSLSLYGMQVFLFETSHYQFGIQLTNNLDGKVLMTFNARNDHDRQKFVEDLKESILETNGMEQLRIEEELQRHRKTHNTLDKHYANDDSRVHMYDLVNNSSDSTVNRLSAPECGLKKSSLSNSLNELSPDLGMKRGSSGASLDSGVVSGSVGSAGSSRDDSIAQTFNSSTPTKVTVKGASITKVSGLTKTISPAKPKSSPVKLRGNLPAGTEV